MRFMVPDGPAGTRETLKQMRQLARIGRADPQIRDLAHFVIDGCAGKDWICEITTLFNFVRQSIRYRLDPNEVELLQSPRQTLLGRTGDCDDMSVLLATLLEVCGHPCRFVAYGFDGQENYSHVLVQCSPAAESDYITLDATENHPPGWEPPNPTWLMMAEI